MIRLRTAVCDAGPPQREGDIIAIKGKSIRRPLISLECPRALPDSVRLQRIMPDVYPGR